MCTGITKKKKTKKKRELGSFRTKCVMRSLCASLNYLSQVVLLIFRVSRFIFPMPCISFSHCISFIFFLLVIYKSIETMEWFGDEEKKVSSMYMRSEEMNLYDSFSPRKVSARNWNVLRNMH